MVPDMVPGTEPAAYRRCETRSRKATGSGSSGVHKMDTTAPAVRIAAQAAYPAGIRGPAIAMPAAAVTPPAAVHG
jgi:hypothetical protein